MNAERRTGKRGMRGRVIFRSVGGVDAEVRWSGVGGHYFQIKAKKQVSMLTRFSLKE